MTIAKASGHKPTPEQEAFIEAVDKGPSVAAEAYAGTAKSTSIQMAAPRVRVPAIALAFNKKIAMELQPRLPANFKVQTFNGFGHSAWARALPGINRMELDERKLGKLVSQVAKDRKVDLSAEQWNQLRRLVSGAMLAGITPGGEGLPLASDDPETWWEVADGLWMLRDDFDFLSDMAHEVLERNNQLSRQGIISFDDQIYASACLGGKFPQFPAMFVDEAQDLSPLNHHQLAQAMRPDGKLVAVGDPRQAIYAFRGADSQSMINLRKLRPEWQERRLTLTFRCPKIVVARNQAHAPGFTAFHTNAEGRFERFRSPEVDGLVGSDGMSLGGWDWSTLQKALPKPGASLAILCRNNGPLLGLAFKLLRRQIGVSMLGRDLGKSLIALARKLAPEDHQSTAEVAGAVRDWQEREVSFAMASGNEHRVSGINDRAECLLAVIQGSEARDAREVRQAIERLFAGNGTQVVLGSIHRSKGLEWDCVLHLDSWRIPSKYAKEAALAGDPRQMEQEWNLKYVCETRSKHTLLEGNLGDFIG